MKKRHKVIKPTASSWIFIFLYRETRKDSFVDGSQQRQKRMSTKVCRSVESAQASPSEPVLMKGSGCRGASPAGGRGRQHSVTSATNTGCEDRALTSGTHRLILCRTHDEPWLEGKPPHFSKTRGSWILSIQILKSPQLKAKGLATQLYWARYMSNFKSSLGVRPSVVVTNMPIELVIMSNYGNVSRICIIPPSISSTIPPPCIGKKAKNKHIKWIETHKALEWIKLKCQHNHFVRLSCERYSDEALTKSLIGDGVLLHKGYDYKTFITVPKAITTEILSHPLVLVSVWWIQY